MKEKDRHNDLNGLGNIADFLHKNPFTVPDHYFTTLTRRTLQRCQHLKRSEDAFAPPPGYFDQLHERVLGKVAEEKLRERVGTPGFTVPAGYFDALPTTILNRVTRDRSTATVSKMVPRTRTWLRYAAAACVVFAIGIIGYAGLVSQPEEHHLDTVSDQEIISYLELYGEPTDITYMTEYLDEEGDTTIELDELSEADIEAYLNNTL